MNPRLLRYARKAKTELAKTPTHKFAADKALVHYASGAVYSFIPKNGCSTMRLSLAVENGCVLGNEEDWNWIHNNNTTFTASLRELVTAPVTFTILRCPFKRLASAFQDKIVSRRPDYWGLYHAENDQLSPETMTFRSFVTLISSGEQPVQNIHWRPQVDFLVYEEYDHWLQFENLKESFSTITEKTGMVIQDARKLTNHGTDSTTNLPNGNYADTSLYDLETHRRNNLVPQYHDYYDAELWATVDTMYRADIDLYTKHFGSESIMPSPIKETNQ